MLKKVLFASAAVLVTAQVAHAADVAVETRDWSGFYLGVNGGYGGGTFDYPMSIKASDLPPPPASVEVASEPDTFKYNFGAENNASGFFGGAQIGYNYQVDSFVLGIEGDISATNIESKLKLYSNTVNADVSGHSEVDWFATARLRGGYAATSNLLLYVTGGAAWGAVTSGFDADLGGFGNLSEDNSTSHMGWTLGGGFEYAVTEHISLKTEYLYVDLGQQNLRNIDLAALADVDASAKLSIDQSIAFSTVKAGINYRF
jgi:outer membrane immunogenic protein